MINLTGYTIEIGEKLIFLKSKIEYPVMSNFKIE